MKASQINIEKLIEKVDFEKIMNLQHFEDYGTLVYVWEDGDVETLGQGTRPGDTDLWYATINCFGRGNYDESTYAEGWAVEQDSEDGSFGRRYVETATGLIMTPDEMIKKCLAEGDFEDSIEMLKDQIREQHQGDADREDDANAMDDYTYSITGKMTFEGNSADVDGYVTISEKSTEKALAEFLEENEDLQFFGTLKTCNADDRESGAVYYDQNEDQRIEIELI